MLRSRRCQTCGIIFEGGPRASFCPDCREARKAKQKAEYVNRCQSGKVRHIGSTDLCVVCGKKYIVASGLQKYCPRCAAQAVAEIDRVQGLKYYNDNKSIINITRNINRRIGKKTCVICGLEFACHGTPRNTCSDLCRKEQIRRYRKKADDKRRGRKR